MRVSPNTLRAGRGLAAAFVGGLLALGASSAAMADAACTGTPSSDEGIFVISKDGHEYNAARLKLEMTEKQNVAEKDRVSVYCIDLHTNIGQGKTYDERDWQSSGVKNLTKIQWVLNNSFPHITEDSLAKAAGISGKVEEKVAYAATQSAVWHFSDGFELKGAKDGAFNESVVKIYDYLTKTAADFTEPTAKLTISGNAATVKVGELAGPFTLVSTQGDITLTASAGKIVDEQGNALTKVASEGKFWVKGEQVGDITVTATGTGRVPAGRVFKSEGSQTLIVAKEFDTKLVSTVKVTVTGGGASSPSPSPAATSGGGEVAPTAAASSAAALPSASKASSSLPVTGTNVGLIVLAGGLLLSAGVAVLMTIRRRRVRFTA